MIFYRASICIPILAMLFVGLCPNAIGDDTAETPVIKSQPQPMDLAKLLSLMPACPDEWVISRSQARTLYQGNLEAYAMREYKQFVLPGKQRPVDAPKPETVVMVIRDTCGLGPHIKPFQEETAPTSGGDFQLGKWARYPAMLVRMSKDRRALRILVEDRYIVEVVFSGNNLKALKWWLGRSKVKELVAAKDQSQITIRDQVALNFLDELRPERNRTYSVPIEPEKPDNSEETEPQDEPQDKPQQIAAE